MKKYALIPAMVLVAAPAMAHTGHGTVFGFTSGLEHPLFGMDHLLAMVAVGLWSGYALPQKFWAGAATFMAAMTVGAGLAWSGVGFPAVETVITLSVLAFGLLTLFARRGQSGLLTGLSLSAIGLFAAAHGHAHATEASGAVLGYLAGFLSATAILHMAGAAMAMVLARGAVAQRILGGGIAAAGLLLMAG